MYKYLSKKSFSSNPFTSKAHTTFKAGSNSLNYYDINTLGSISIFKNKSRQITILNKSFVGKCT